MTAKRFRLEVLGPPRLRGEDGDVVLGAGIPLSLLAYLEQGGRSHARDHLATLFWPGTSRGRALQSLRQALLRLRNGSRHDILLEEGGLLGVNAAQVTSDLADFRDAVRDGRVRDALALWRGSYLDGFRRAESWELEDWIEGLRSSLSHTLTAAVLEESEALLLAFRAQEAVDLMSVALSALGDEESVLRGAVEAHAAAGHRAEAEGLLSRLVAMDPLEEVESLRKVVSQVRVTHPSEPPPAPPVVVVPTPDAAAARPRPRRRTWPRRVAVAAALVVVAFTLGLSWSGSGAAGVAAGQGQNVLVYCDTRATDGSFAQLFRMDFDGANKHRITQMESCLAVFVAEAGGLMALVRLNDGSGRLALLQPDTINAIAEWTASLPEGTEQLRDPLFGHGAPVVSRGRYLVFSAEDATGNRDIYAWDAHNGQLRRLTVWEGRDEMPSVDPQGDRVVFVSFRTGAGDLYSLSLQGDATPVRLTEHALWDSRPQVRGDSVLFVRGLGTGPGDGDMELMLLDLSTGGEAVLTDNNWNDFEPVWSPNGRQICWQSEESGHYESDVWVMDVASRRSWNVSRHAGRDSDCLWTPAGDGVVFLSTRTGKARVFLAPAHGGTPLDLSGFEEYAGAVSVMPRPEPRKALR